MGGTEGTWNKFFGTLEALCPKTPFNVGVFSSEAEIKNLRSVFFPWQWQTERPDILLSSLPEGPHRAPWLHFLDHVQQISPQGEFHMGLVVENLGKTLAKLIQVAPLTLILDKGSRFTLSDPAFLLNEFPDEFPRLRADSQISSIRMTSSSGLPAEVNPKDLPNGTLVGFSEIEAIFSGGQGHRPRDWLRSFLKGHGIGKIPKAAGLIREAKGVFLFPGIPLSRVQGVVLGGVVFSHLIDRKKMSPTSPHFAAFLDRFNETGIRNDETWRAFQLLNQEAESKTDIPVVVAGNHTLLRESLANLLSRRGFQRCYTLDKPGENLINEPSLVLQVSPFEGGSLGPQIEEPIVVEVGKDLNQRLKDLDGLLPWRDLAFKPPPADIPALGPDAFSKAAKRIVTEVNQGQTKEDDTLRKAMLLGQEVEILTLALEKGETLLEAEDAEKIWKGELDESVKQLVIFTHDQEEAGAIMQAAGHIPKKRWVDLSAFEEGESLSGLNLEELSGYQGHFFITGNARGRLETLIGQAKEGLGRAQGEWEENEVLGKLATAQRAEALENREKLARNWFWIVMDQWVEDYRGRMARHLNTLKEKQERRWFNRTQIHKLVILPSRVENRTALTEACKMVYPGLNINQSVMVPYEFQAAEELPEIEAQVVVEESHLRNLSDGATKERLKKALKKYNENLFADYLQVVATELKNTRVDLLFIEHHPKTAHRILSHIKMALPQFKNTPALLLLSDFWAPAASMPWPRTRVAFMRRMGALNPEEVAEQIRALYAL